MESKSESDSHTLGQSHWSLPPISPDLAHSQLDLYHGKFAPNLSFKHAAEKSIDDDTFESNILN